MFKNKWRIAITVGMLSSTLAFLGLYPRPAWAINIIDNATCQKSNDYFKFWTTNDVICYPTLNIGE